MIFAIVYSSLRDFCPQGNTDTHYGMKMYMQSTHMWDSNLLANFPMILQLTKRDWSVWEICALETSGFRIYTREKEEMSQVNHAFPFFKNIKKEKIEKHIYQMSPTPLMKSITTKNNNAFLH